MKIPKRKNVYKTNEEDPAFLHYWPLVGLVYKKRLKNTLSLLGTGYGRLLDIGYGSGILFPEISQRASVVHGLEIHNNKELVYRTLQRENITNVSLERGDIYETPYQNNFFDCVVSVSTFEHLEDLDKAMKEVKRIVREGGDIILSFPVRSKVTDAFYKFVGYKPRHIHPSSHNDIIGAAGRHFKIKKILSFPKFKNINLALYISIKCENEI